MAETNVPPEAFTEDVEEIEETGNVNEADDSQPRSSKSEVGLSQVSIEPRSSFYLEDLNHQPLEGMAYEATWKMGNNETSETSTSSLTSFLSKEQEMLECRFLWGNKGNKGKEKKQPSATLGNDVGSSPPSAPYPGTPNNSLKFVDCGGLEKQVSFIKTALLGPLMQQNSQYKRFGLGAPKGILFHGPPGTGKTRLAQAIGNEITQVLKKNVHFIYRKGQDIASKWFGRSSENLRQVFEEAKVMQPCVLFFDELDGLCPRRDKPNMNQANMTIVTTMLGLMDELPKGKVFVIGATNRLDSIDPALRRPGRFDKYLEFNLPSEKGRMDIITIHTNHWKVKPSKEIVTRLAKQTVGFTGADLSKLCLDTFDVALNRVIAESDSFKVTDFTHFEVHERDWLQALRGSRPSNAKAFGSSMYSPSAIIGHHLEPLVSRNVNKVVDLIRAQLSRKEAGKINVLFVWSNSGNSIGKFSNIVVSEALKSSTLSNVPVYAISSASLAVKTKKDWPQKVAHAFNQVLQAPSPAILYVKDVEEFSQVLAEGRLGCALNMKRLIEQLRGENVLLLVSGTSHPTTFPFDNGFRDVMMAGSEGIMRLERTQDELAEFFQPIFTKIILQSEKPLSQKNLMSLLKIFDQVVDNFQGKKWSHVVGLYDALKQSLPHENWNAQQFNGIFKRLAGIVGSYNLP